MGNCMRHEESSSSVNWGGEDWGSLANDERDHKHMRKTNKKIEEEEEEEEEEEGHIEGTGGFGSYDSSKAKVPVLPGGASEVKIKMTKKQLEELMGRVELKQMTVQQVLAQLIISVSTTSTDPYETSTDHHRPWRPVLQSIPEVN